MLKRAMNLVSHVADRSLEMLILFITGQCNARCRSCFYWDSLNHNNDLSFEELRRIIQTIPPFRVLLLSGGEPFLRKDLPDIVSLFGKHCGISQVAIPTNGLLEEQMVKAVETLFTLLPDIDLLISFSVDGLGDVHDSIRGVRNNFEKSMQSIKRVAALKADNQYANLKIQINSVICAENIRHLYELADFIEEHLWYLHDYRFELVRGNPMDANMITQRIPEEELQAFYKRVAELQARCGRRKADESKSLLDSLLVGMRLAHLRLVQEIQRNSYYGRNGWGFPCMAGHTVGVIEHEGSVRLCELRKRVANLRDYDYDFMKLWNSVDASEERAQIRKDRCEKNCTHICFIQRSMEKSPGVVFHRLPKDTLLNIVGGTHGT